MTPHPSLSPTLATTATGQAFLDRVRLLSDPVATPTASLELALTAAVGRVHAPQWVTVTIGQRCQTTARTAPHQR